MDYVIVCAAALGGSALTFFSGFGLGTILLPVFSLFFPVELAIALTAIVHLLNNLFKLALVGRLADRKTVLRFGLPSLLAAFAGAAMLGWLADHENSIIYEIGGSELRTTALRIVIGSVLLFFVLFELLPPVPSLQLTDKHLVAGGLLSGFFGGLSGMQGALRSAFLIKSGLGKEAFIATGVVIACMVDVARLTIYSGQVTSSLREIDWTIVISAAGAAFTGAFTGARLMKKVTLRTVQKIVALLLVIFSLLFGAGIL